MNKRIIYSIPLLVLVVMWGFFGFAVASPAYAQPAVQDTAAPTVVVATVVVTTVVNTIVAPVGRSSLSDRYTPMADTTVPMVQPIARRSPIRSAYSIAPTDGTMR